MDLERAERNVCSTTTQMNECMNKIFKFLVCKHRQNKLSLFLLWFYSAFFMAESKLSNELVNIGNWIVTIANGRSSASFQQDYEKFIMLAVKHLEEKTILKADMKDHIVKCIHIFNSACKFQIRKCLHSECKRLSFTQEDLLEIDQAIIRLNLKCDETKQIFQPL